MISKIFTILSSDRVNVGNLSVEPTSKVVDSISPEYALTVLVSSNSAGAPSSNEYIFISVGSNELENLKSTGLVSKNLVSFSVEDITEFSGTFTACLQLGSEPDANAFACTL